MRSARLLASATAVAALPMLAAPALAADWPMFGQTLQNTAASPQEKLISTANVPRLAPKWVATTGGDVSARAAVVDGVVYFPDWGGNLWALNARTGKTVWHRTLAQLGFPADTVSRTSPAVRGGTVYFGTQTGAYLVAIDAKTGDLRWRSQIDSHPEAIITASPAVSDHVVYLGVASNEEGAAADPTYPCCSFRGSVAAVDAHSGAILWKTFTVPPGYTGGGVWGSNPVVDEARHLVFVGTGNNYSAPTDPAYTSCIQAGGTERSCRSAHDHFDSILALDSGTGQIRWHRRLAGADDWNVACFASPGGVANCPAGSGPDYDFGSAPNEFTIRGDDGSTVTILGAGQKSGVYSAFDPDTGALLWGTQVGPGATLGGIEWGSATDGRRIYVAISNSDGRRYPAGHAGSWSALDPRTGHILWQTPDPNAAIDLGPMATANGIVYAPSMGGAPGQANMFALDAARGTVLWSFNSGASVNAGATIADGSVYWGSGYAHLGITGFTGNTKFYAFSLDGK